jgi:hypothetical protein
MAPPFLYAQAVKVWQGRASGANLTLDTRFPGRLSSLKPTLMTAPPGEPRRWKPDDQIPRDWAMTICA